MLKITDSMNSENNTAETDAAAMPASKNPAGDASLSKAPAAGNILLTVAFLCVIFGMLIASAAAKDSAFSESENRPLASVPSPSVAAILSGEFERAFESYAQDQAVMRDEFMRMRSLADIMTAKRDNGRVYFGRDGYLFAIEDVDGDVLEKNMKAVMRFAAAIGAHRGVKTDLLVAPTATEVLHKKLPPFAPVPAQREALKRIADIAARGELPANAVSVAARGDEFRPIVHDVTDALAVHANDYIYYKTDHHWTSRGAAYAYAEFSGKGDTYIAENYRMRAVSDDFKGTNYARAMIMPGGSDTIEKFEKIKKNGKSRKSAESSESEKSANLVESEKSKIPEKELRLRQFNARGELTKDIAGLYDPSQLVARDQYSYFLAGNSPLTLISAGDDPDIEIDKQIKIASGKKNLLVIKDSFANCFIPFLTEDYDNILIVDLRYYRGNLLKLSDDCDIGAVLILYNILNFSQDTNILRLGQY